MCKPIGKCLQTFQGELKEARGAETAAAYAIAVLATPHYWVLSPLEGTPQA
jgi:hypothetical protein